MKKTTSYAVLIMALAFTWLASAKVDTALNRRSPIKVSKWAEGSTLFKGEALRVVAMGYDTSLADYFYLKMIQYFANQSDNKLPMNNMIHFVDAIATLDPKFAYAYEFAWTVLTTFDVRPYDVKVKDAGDILRKGWMNNSDSWQIAQDLGFHNFYYEANFEQAANMYEAAFRLNPKVPLFAQLASRMRSEAGKPELALSALQQQLEIAKDPKIRAALEYQIQLVNVEITARRIDDRVEMFHKDKGRLPDSLSELVTAGYIKYIPSDGMGGTFKWDPEKQEVVSTSTPRLKANYSIMYKPPWKQ